MQIDIDWRDIFGECSLQMQKANTKRKWREIKNWQGNEPKIKQNVLNGNEREAKRYWKSAPSLKVKSI